MNQEESEHNEVDGMKKAVDSTGEVMHKCDNAMVNFFGDAINLCRFLVKLQLHCASLALCVSLSC